MLKRDLAESLAKMAREVPGLMARTPKPTRSRGRQTPTIQPQLFKITDNTPGAMVGRMCDYEGRLQIDLPRHTKKLEGHPLCF